MSGCGACMACRRCLLVGAGFGYLSILSVPPLRGKTLTDLLAVALGAVPMLFVMYTTRPFVTWIHLSLPASVRESPEAVLTYARNLPSNAKLHIGTMGLNIQPQRSEVKLTDVGPVKSMFRPVTFGVINPGVARDKWWKQKSLLFYTKEGSGTGKDTRNSVPGVWENVLRHILKT